MLTGKVGVIPAFIPFKKKARHKVAHGGRGSGKSWAVAEMLIWLSLESRIRILCGREVQKSILESSHRLLANTIAKCEVSPFFDVQKTKIYNLHTGSEFIFKGIRDLTSTTIKGLENISICWIDEAQYLTKSSFVILGPTVRSEDSEIWMTLNPVNPLDFVYQEFIARKRDDTILLEVNYDKNPHFPAVLEAERVRMKRTDPELYQHVWEGKPVGSSDKSIIKSSWFDACVDADKNLGLDFSGHKSIGLDLADGGKDYNAMCLMDGSKVVSVEEWDFGKDQLMQTAKYAYNAALTKGASIQYDSIGVGAAIGSKLYELNDANDTEVEIERFLAGGAVTDPEHDYVEGVKNKTMFLNAKAQKWWGLADRMRNTWDAVTNGVSYDPGELIAFSSDLKMIDKLKAELTSPRRGFNLLGKVKVESKEDMLARGVPSTNLGDSVIMATVTPEQEGVYAFV